MTITLLRWDNFDILDAGVLLYLSDGRYIVTSRQSQDIGRLAMTWDFLP